MDLAGGVPTSLGTSPSGRDIWGKSVLGRGHLEAIAAVAEGVSESEALALRLALRIDMLAAQQNRETLGRRNQLPPVATFVSLVGS